MSRLFISGDQSIGASASASVLPMTIQGWFPLGLTSLISLLSKGLSKVFSNTTVWKHQLRDTLIEGKYFFSLLHFIKFQLSLQKTRCHLQHSFGAPGGSDNKRVCLQCRRPGFGPCVGKILWRRKWQPTPVFLPGESHGHGITKSQTQLSDFTFTFFHFLKS